MKIYQPMLAKTTKTYPNSSEYIYEPKYDGIRCLAYVNNKTNYHLINRSLIDVTTRFPEVQPNVEAACVLDGELVCFDKNNIPNFQLMQTRMNRKYNIPLLALNTPAVYIPFDIIEMNEIYVGDLPLVARKELLDTICPDSTLWWTSTEPTVTQTYLEQGWEGVMVKLKHAIYQPGLRSPGWLKYKFLKSLTATILGYTQGYGRRLHTFGSLIMGLRNDNTYIYLGEVGTGFTDLEIDHLKSLCDAQRIYTPAVADPAVQAKVWCKPVIDILVQYLEISNDGILRFPVYKGLVS